MDRPTYLVWVIRQHGRPLEGGYGRVPVWIVSRAGGPPSSCVEEMRRAQRTLRLARRGGTFATLPLTLGDRFQYAGLGARHALVRIDGASHEMAPGRLDQSPCGGSAVRRRAMGPSVAAMAGLKGPGRGVGVMSRVLAMTYPDRYFPCTCRMIRGM
ncbi:MAG: hypothetical protein ACP5QO_11445 [Clostridia bacterium]